MALLYPPSVGEVFECEFPSCLAAPEMRKKRLVIVVGPKLIDRDSRLVNVVPISMTAPPAGCVYQPEVPISAIPGRWQSAPGKRWAKCDMVYTLSIERLSMAQGARSRATDGKRQSFKGKVDLATLQEIRRCVAHAMGITAALWPTT